MSRTVLMRTIIVVLAVLLPTFTYAHTGIAEANSFMHVLAHSLDGLGYVCLILVGGGIAVYFSRR